MKRFLLAAFIFGAAVFGISAQEQEKSEIFIKVDSLLSAGFLQNQAEITELSSGLTNSERESLYETYERSGVVPFLFNFLIGFGIGSFYQEDNTAGMIAMIGDAVGGITAITGSIMLAASAHDIKNLEKNSETVPNSLKSELHAGVGLLIAGGVTFVGFEIFSSIRPWIVANQRNKALKNALNGTSAAEVSFLPLLDPVESKYGLMASVRF